MNKKILLISSVLLTLSIILVVTINNMDNKDKNIISNAEKDKQVINSNMITMMYETEAGSKEYVETKDNTWPESGYIFNDILSGCENGGELEYNSENNTVNLLSNKSDRCYVYFDKYDGVWINNVSTTNVTGSSVTLDVSATSENGSITKYYYSLNDNEEYQEATSNVITINNLNKLTEYKISIYAIDNTNAKSNLYEISVSTTDDDLPKIDYIVINNITTNSISLQINSTDDINSYFFAINDENFISIDNNCYTFNNLSANTNYLVKVYLKDNNGFESEVKSLTIKTKSILFIDYIKKLYTSDGQNGLYFHDGAGVYGKYEACDNSYRYAGANPDNVVCFGSDLINCPYNNLYRIIGIIDNKIKLIKYDYANTDILGTNGISYETATLSNNYKGQLTVVNTFIGSSYSGNNFSYKWATSELNTINLNTNFLNSVLEWKNFIDSANWYIGIISTEGTPQDYYNAEHISNYYNNYIGLISPSEYAYAASPEYWYLDFGDLGYIDNNEIRENNWINMGVSEWTICQGSGSLYINNGIKRDTFNGNTNAVRPVFYLNSDVVYLSGSGTESDPYRIGL